MITLANIRRAIYNICKRLDILERNVILSPEKLDTKADKSSTVSVVELQNFTEALKEMARINIGLDNLSRLGNGFGICSTNATVAAKEVTIPNFLLLTNGTISVRFTKAISVSDATLNVSGTGAKPILINDYPLSAGVIKARTTATLCYDGTNWNITTIMDYEQGSIPDLYVDMGLPSGVLWAKKNIDITQQNGFAASEFQYECSFCSWGNTDMYNPKNTSSFDYNWGGVNAEEPYYEGQPYGSTPGAALTADFGPSFDAARRHLGAPWRMPSTEEFKELFDNCDFIDADGNIVTASTSVAGTAADKRITMNGIVGLRIRSKINGNVIFFPASGYGFGTSWGNRGASGLYWSSSWYSARLARILGFYPSGVSPQNTDGRYYGFAVRPVQ